MPNLDYLYKPIEPFNSFHLDVSDLHKVYVEECGNPAGMPVLFIHGGPGAGCSADDRRFFNPEHYRIILFDQRGCGRSKPLASIEDNTTQHLVSDIEKIRSHLKIDNWIVFGGSWGSTLSLVYTETFPKRVSALVVRGVFLAKDENISYLNRAETKRFYPQEYEEYLNFIDKDKRNNLQSAYYELMKHGDKNTKVEAAKKYRNWEMNSAFLTPPAEFAPSDESPTRVLAESLIQCHYLVNRCFLEENQIKHNLDAIYDIPTFIVNGRYDLLCPPDIAYELHQAHPNSELFICQEAGHVSREKGTGEKLVEIMDNLARAYLELKGK